MAPTNIVGYCNLTITLLCLNSPEFALKNRFVSIFKIIRAFGKKCKVKFVKISI